MVEIGYTSISPENANFESSPCPVIGGRVVSIELRFKKIFRAKSVRLNMTFDVVAFCGSIRGVTKHLVSMGWG